jgi:uncharacterized metal-binding protein
MPSGRVHRRLWRRWRGLAFAGAILLVAQGHWILGLSLPLGYTLGSVVDPDMDMPRTTTYAKSKWKILKPWWTAYGHISQRLFGGHRSTFSHMPVLSSLFRLIWLSIPFTLPPLILFPRATISLLVSPVLTNFFLGTLLGLSLADLVHVIADLIWR